MALINCFECNKQISDQAPACPHCGVPLKALLTLNQKEVTEFHIQIKK